MPGRYTRGFEYSDCFVDDARLVVLNARDAADRGAEIRTRTRAVEIRQVDGIWQVTVENTVTKAALRPSARARWSMPAAPGSSRCWPRAPASTRAPRCGWCRARTSSCKKLYEHDRAYMFQNADGRIVFVIPYQDDFTLIGTTDRDYHGDPAKVKATAEEIKYLCDSVSEYLAKPVAPEDVVWTYAGVRPLYDDGASEAKAATRDYVFELDTPGGAPLLSIYGGKITTYRRLAEEALERLAPYLAQRQGARGLDRQIAAARRRSRRLGAAGADRGIAAQLSVPHAGACEPARACLWHARRQNCSAAPNRLADLGQSFGATLTAAEVRYLMASEWAVTAEDIVWRRSKLGLRMSEDEIAAIDGWIAANRVPMKVPCWKREDGHERHARPCHPCRRWRSDHPRRLADAGEGHAQRAARPDAVGQDLDHAAARRPRQADHRPRAGRRQGRHRLRRAPALGRDGLSAVHQLSVADRL